MVVSPIQFLGRSPALAALAALFRRRFLAHPEVEELRGPKLGRRKRRVSALKRRPARARGEKQVKAPGGFCFQVAFGAEKQLDAIFLVNAPKETSKYLGIHKGIESEARVFLRWGEMEFVDVCLAASILNLPMNPAKQFGGLVPHIGDQRRPNIILHLFALD